MSAIADLVSDLKVLRKGRGLFAGNVGERVGPALRNVCDVSDEDSATAIRARVAERLTKLADDLPDDLRVAALAAFALAPDARLPLYQDRVNRVAQLLDRDPRTARRRIDDAIHQLAQLALTRTPVNHPLGPSPGWHTTEIRIVMLLDREPEVLEFHRIVAEQENLTEIDPSTMFGGNTSVIFGATLRSGILVLPSPLRRGEWHEFALRIRLPETPQEAPYVPRNRCDRLDLRVRFDRTRVPSRIALLRGDPPRSYGSVHADAAGEIHLTFHDLAVGESHGVSWNVMPDEVESGSARSHGGLFDMHRSAAPPVIGL